MHSRLWIESYVNEILIFLNIFSQFDSGFNLPVIFLTLFILSSMGSVFLSSSLLVLWNESSSILNENFLSLYTSTLFSVWGSILLINLFGLIPFGFSISSQAWFSLLLAVIVFLTFLSSSIFSGVRNFFSHFVPSSSPISLGNILFWLEVVSVIVRPVTLILRLCANMVAGHVLLTLLSESLSTAVISSPLGTSISFLLLGLVIFFFELFVSFIQSVVFTLLLNSYFSEL